MNHRHLHFCTLAVGAALALASQARAAGWDESVHGDLSDDGLAPTALIFGAGSNAVIGVTGNDGSGIDRDYARFTVPDGWQLDAITVLPNTAVSGGSSFFAIQSGSQVTAAPNGEGAAALLGYAHFGNDAIGQNLLPLILLGGTSALPSGSYAIWVQETGGLASYGFDFVLSPVPEPASAAMLSAGLLLLSLTRFGRAKRTVR